MAKKIIDIQNVSYTYDSFQEAEKKKALDDVSLSIEKGEWIALIGPNGSGKSTLVKTITGILEPTDGNIVVDGLLLNEENIWKIREKVGMVFQNPDNQFVGSTVEDDVAFGLENQGLPREEMVPRVEDALRRVGMLESRDRQPANLSGGQKQRVAIGGVLVIRPDVIIMDESTSMLDPKAREEVLMTVRQIKETENMTVISITHDINEAAEASRVVVMQAGKIVEQGTPAEIFQHGDELIDMGLDVPFPEQLKAALEELGVNVPEEYLTEEGMMDWLWTFN